MRSLINHLQAECKLHNLEASRCKKRCKELEEEISKLKSKLEALLANSLTQQVSVTSSETTTTGSTTLNQIHESPTNKDENVSSTMNQLPTTPKQENRIKEDSNETVSRTSERTIISIRLSFLSFRMKTVVLTIRLH